MILVVAKAVVPVATKLEVLTAPKFPIFAKRFWNIPVTLFIKLETIESAVVVPVKLILFRLTTLLVEITPFMLEINVLVVVAKDNMLEVEDANNPLTEVVDITPLTLDIKSDPNVVRELFEITLLVAATPFIVVVRMLPLND